MHGGVAKDDLKTENVAAVAKGCDNLKRHIENVNKFGVPAVVAINKFVTDTDAEVAEVQKAAESMGTKAFLCTHWSDGGKGTEALAHHVVKVIDEGKANFKPLYPDEMTLRDKVKTIATGNLSRRRYRLRRQPSNAVQGFRGRRLRPFSGVHGEDAVFVLDRSDEARRADGPHRADP